MQNENIIPEESTVETYFEISSKKLSLCLTLKKKSNVQCIEIYRLSNPVEISDEKVEQDLDINLNISNPTTSSFLCQVKQMTFSKKSVTLITKTMYF